MQTCSTLDPHTVNMLACLHGWCRCHWTFNTLTGVALEEVRINSENLVLLKLTINQSLILKS